MTLIGSVPRGGAPGAAGLEEGQELPLVVGGAAGDRWVSPLGCLHSASARTDRCSTELERIDRLHVVVGVEDGTCGPLPFGPWATTTGWPGVGRAEAVKPSDLRSADQPVGSALALRRHRPGSVEIDLMAMRSRQPLAAMPRDWRRHGRGRRRGVRGRWAWCDQPRVLGLAPRGCGQPESRFTWLR